MKNIINLSILLLFVVTFAACSNEESTSSRLETSIAERFAVCKDAAVYHSAGLDFAYSKLKEMKQANPEKRLFSNFLEKEKIALLISFSAEFISQKQISSNLAVINNKIDLVAFEESVYIRKDLRASTDIELSPEVIKMCTYFDSVVDQIVDISTVELTIEQAMRSEIFAAFSEDEQNTLLIMFAVYEDSSKYWEDNMENWMELLTDENSSDNLRTDLTTPIDEIAETAKRNGWKADGAGALTGAIGGALFGSTVGPAGTIGGAIGGALEGAIVSSLLEIIRADYKSSNLTPSSLEIINRGLANEQDALIHDKI